MADGGLPINTRQFSSTFLDFWRNSRGYVEEVRTADRDAVKRFLSPFILKDNNNSCSKCFPECHPLGNAMWNFAKQCTALHSQPNSQSTDVNLPASCWKFKKDDKSGHNGVGNGDDDDDDDDVGPDYNFQLTHCNADDLSHSSLPSVSCSTSNVPLSLACKTTELVKQQHFKPHTGALQSDFTGSGRLSKATNISTSDNSNQDTATGPNKFSRLQNRKHLLHCDEEPTSKAGVDQKTADATAPNYNTTSNLNDDIYSDSDNSGNGASQNNHGHNIELVIASEETELSSNSSQPRKCEDQHSAVDTKKSLGSNLLVDNKTYNNKEDMFSEEISAAYMSTRSDVMKGDDDTLDNSPCDDMEYSNELHYEKPQIKPLSLYKCVEINRKNISTTVALNLKLKALQSVLHTEARILRNAVYEDVDVCGKVAILHGFQEEGSLYISVVESEVVGLYDYIAGTVLPLQQGSHPHDLGYQDIKDPLPSSVNLSVDLCEFLCQHIPRASSLLTTKDTTSLKEHYPVAWLLTSSALGLTLDCQVQEKVLKCVKEMSCGKSNVEELAIRESKTDQCSKHWYNILVVVDEYRCAGKGFPQIEVYQFCAHRIVNLVNFDIN